MVRDSPRSKRYESEGAVRILSPFRTDDERRNERPRADAALCPIKGEPLMDVRTPFFVLLFTFVSTAVLSQTVEPLPLTSSVIEGGAGGTEDIYFTFTAGPGEITALAEARFTADAGDAILTVDFLGVNDAGVATTLAGTIVGRGRQRAEEALRRGIVGLLPETAAHAPMRKRTRVVTSLDESQTVVLHLRAGTGISFFRVSLDGPIDYAPADDVLAGAPTDSSEEPQPEVMSEEEWAAGEADAAAETSEIEVPVDDGNTANAGDELPPPTSEAKPPIRIPGRLPKTLKIPGKTTTVVTKPPVATPIQIKPNLIHRVPSKPPLKIVKITKSAGATTKVPVENKKKPPVKLPLIVKKGGAQ
jgi:hypothetical protein